jgi:hypothetical protein
MMTLETGKRQLTASGVQDWGCGIGKEGFSTADELWDQAKAD